MRSTRAPLHAPDFPPCDLAMALHTDSVRDCGREPATTCLGFFAHTCSAVLVVVARAACWAGCVCRMDYVPEQSALNVDHINVDSETKAMLDKLGLAIHVNVKDYTRRPNNRPSRD